MSLSAIINSIVYLSTRRLVILLVVLFLAVPFGSTSMVYAVTINVTNSSDSVADDGWCTLREAITSANSDTASGASAGECPAGSGADTIIVPADTYTLNRTGSGEDANVDGDLDITSDLTITGAGSASTIVDGNWAVTGERVFHVVGSVTVSIMDLQITGGNGPGGNIHNGGGGVRNEGDLRLNNCRITGNTTSDGSPGNPGTDAGSGGGVLNYSATLTMTDCTVDANTTGKGGDGAGTDDSGGNGGWGAGIYTFYGTLSLTDCTISGNTSGDGGNASGLGINGGGGNGGGVHAYESGTRTITACTISGNNAGSKGTGGSFGGDGAGGGYGTYGGTHTFTNCTISGNNAPGSGGGINGSWDSAITVIDSTIALNTAWDGGGYSHNGGGDNAFFRIRNSIVADNAASELGPDLRSTGNKFYSLGYNLIETTSGWSWTTAGSDLTGNILGTDPNLGVLGNNGGPTQTQALPSSSAAVDAGHPTTYSATDQRGIVRPQDGDGDSTAVSDIGAFELVEYYTLTVTKAGTAGGTVSSSPAGIDCGSDCSEVFAQGASVTLTAVPDAGSALTSWSGDCSGTNMTMNLTMDSDRTCIANFDVTPVPTYTLDVQKTGGGTGTVTSSPAGIDCGLDCSEVMNEGTLVTLTAAPDSDSNFVSWSGGCSGANPTVYLTMDSDISCTANLALANVTYDLTVTKAGDGTGTVTSSPAGIDCGSDCSETIGEGNQVTLTAAPDTNSIFSSWSGDCSGTEPDVTLTMASDKTCTANFDAAQNNYTLIVQKDGGGSGTVTSSPAGIDCGSDCSESFGEGSRITLTGTPDSGQALDGWRGVNCPGNHTCTFSMVQDSTITATFNPDDDGDGISTGTEDGGPNNGDGDGNGVPDSQEPNVTTFPNIENEYVTLAAESGAELKEVSAQGNPSLSDSPSNTLFPNGFYGFKVQGLAPGAATSLDLILHNKDSSLDTYYKYGPTSGSTTDHWYEFLYDQTVGADIHQESSRTRIVLHFVDGLKGDGDLEGSNGIVVDPSGPGNEGGSTPGAGGGGGGGCFLRSCR